MMTGAMRMAGAMPTAGGAALATGGMTLAVRETERAPFGGDPEGEVEWEEGQEAESSPAESRLPEATPAERAEADRQDALAEEIARLAGHDHAFKYHLLTLIAEFDRSGGWEPRGYGSCAAWLSQRTGYARITAREYVRVARALEALPHTSHAMARGRLSFCQVRALTRVATPEHEEELVALAEGATTAQLERMVRGWKKGTRGEEEARERERRLSRRLVIFPDDDGMVVIRGRLMPEVGEVVMKALEAAEDALFREEDRPDPSSRTPSCSARARRRRARRRRADAAGLVAERALAAGFTGEAAEVSGTRAERYLAFLHVDRETLEEGGPESEAGRSELGATGTRVSCETARRLTCDVGLVPVYRGPRGEVLDVGRKRRTVPPAIRRALEVRDRGCRFPGCGLRFTAAHHLEHWADGGRTSLRNSLLLCRFHHRLVHEGGWTVEWWGKGKSEGRGYAVFRDPRGGVHTAEPPEPPELAEDPVRAVVRENRSRGRARQRSRRRRGGHHGC